MDLLYVLDYRFFRTPDGATWTPATYSEPFWERYLNVFQHVHVISRALPVEQPEADWQRVDGSCVKVHAIPFYLGPVQYLLRSRAVRCAMARALDREGAVILRVPSQLATSAESILKSARRGFGVEVVGDPKESFAPGAVRHPLRALFRRHYTRNQLLQCRTALGASYVANRLEHRYPCESGGFSTICSDVFLPPEAFDTSRLTNATAKPLRIVTVASLDQLYKGIDILLEAVAACAADGMDLSLRIVGSGKYRGAFESRALQPDLAGRVEFLGELPAGQAVRDVLKQASLFVLPSRTEGMPRALLEAMAQGLPCLGTQVGGIPELLDKDDTFPADDSHALTVKLRDVSSGPQRLLAMSQRNLQTARGFREEILQARRESFYRFLQNASTDRTTVARPLPWWKRPLDLIGAVGLGLATLPVWLGAAVLVRLAMGSPVLFRQPRPGRGGRKFVLYKFRTMRVSAGGGGIGKSDVERLTRLGTWLRRLSIDELPQLWNVITGDMSLVGPRPLLIEYLPLYTEKQRRRHEVNSGLTGWAQIHGRNQVPWSERLELDVWYADHQSLWRDLYILFASVGHVLRSGGITQAGQATMTPFSGTAPNHLPGNGASGN